MAALSLVAGNLNLVKATGTSQGSSATKKGNNAKSNSVDEKGNSIKPNNVDVKGNSIKPNNVNAKGDNTKSNSSAVSKTRKISLSKGKKISLGLGAAILTALVYAGIKRDGKTLGETSNSEQALGVVASLPNQESVSNESTSPPLRLLSESEAVYKMPSKPKENDLLPSEQKAKKWNKEFKKNKKLINENSSEVSEDKLKHLKQGADIALKLKKELYDKFEFSNVDENDEITVRNKRSNATVKLIRCNYGNVKVEVSKEEDLQRILDGAVWLFYYYALILEELEYDFTFDSFGVSDERPFFVCSGKPGSDIELESSIKFFNIFECIQSDKTEEKLEAFKSNLNNLKKENDTYDLSGMRRLCHKLFD